MQHDNPIPFTTRLKELFIDWLVISGYLLCLFGVSMAYYNMVLGGIPKFSELHSQLVVATESVIVIVILFSYLDLKGGSIGKRATGLQLYFTHKSLAHSLIRNGVKFLPWQIGHMGVIRGMYTEFDVPSIVLVIVACLLFVLLFFMGTMRRDRRHIGDMLAGTQVQRAKLQKKTN